jgi:hypothetical protein
VKASLTFGVFLNTHCASGLTAFATMIDRPAILVDVAEHAQVSLATVDRVFNRRPNQPQNR